MGFDLIGLKAQNNKGEYFRNNCWWWRPLADYILSNVDLPIAKQSIWEFNDGGTITAKQSIKIADKLEKLMKEGKTKEYEKEWNKKDKENPTFPGFSYPFSEKNVKEFAIFCRNSGGFRIC